MKTVADLIAERELAERELAELEAEASALLVNLESALARIRELRGGRP